MPRAGLTTAAVTEAAAALADEIGFASLSMGLLAERLGVRAPALYKHVDNLADLTHRIAVLAWVELADAMREATQGRAGTEALSAGAHAMRRFVKGHPGRYAAANATQSTGPGDPLVAAAGRVIAPAVAMLHGYQLEPTEEIHAVRMLRSTLHGFITFEVTGGFQIDVDPDDSFTWMIDFIDRGLHASTAQSRHADVD